MKKIYILGLLLIFTVARSETVFPATPEGKLAISVAGQEFLVNQPETYNAEIVKPAPVKGKFIPLCPRYDKYGSIVLGGFFRMIDPATVKVTSSDGSVVYRRDVDYTLDEEWAKVSAIDGRLGTNDVKVSGIAFMQRIDLVQKAPDNSFSIKMGKSALWCPAIPEPDQGCKPIAGVYVAPWKIDGEWRVTEDNIFPIKAYDKVKPLNSQSLVKTVKKLKEGKTVKVAFLGDSITLGAEAGPWWKDISRTFRGLVQSGLKKKYPDAEILPVDAFFGGKGIDKVLEVLDDEVIACKPDVAIVALGINDVWPEKNGKPKVSPENFKAGMEELVKKLKSADCDVVLVTEMQPNPFDPEGTAELWKKYVLVQRNIAVSLDVALADVYTEWMNQRYNGIYPFSMLHNSINHPGIKGHKLFADVILDCF